MEDLSFISWNIRRIYNSTAKRNLNSLLKKCKPFMVLIQETKCSNWTDSLMDSIWSRKYHGWLTYPAEGLSGGLLLSWDSTLVTLLDHKCFKHWIWFMGKSCFNNEILNIINIYAPQVNGSKRCLWLEIQSILISYQQEPIAIMGDFNSIRSNLEAENCIYRNVDASDLNDFIIRNNLWDIPLQGHKFTWFGSSNKMSKLDRVLINVNWPSGKD